MQAIQKKAAAATPARRPPLGDLDDPANLVAFVLAAGDDPRAAAGDLAHYLDCKCTHHEGSDAARIIDDWAYDPSADSLDTMVWYAGLGQTRLSASVHVALCAVIAAARSSGF